MFAIGTTVKLYTTEDGIKLGDVIKLETHGGTIGFKPVAPLPCFSDYLFLGVVVDVPEDAKLLKHWTKIVDDSVDSNLLDAYEC